MRDFYILFASLPLAIAQLGLHSASPSRDKVDLLVGILFLTGARIPQEHSVQLAPDVVDRLGLVREHLIFVGQVLVRHEQVQQPRMELRVHHYLDPIGRLHIGELQEVIECLLAYLVV